MERRKVDILCVQETRWKGSKARSIGAGFKLFYYGVDSKRNGVGVVLKEEFVRNVLEVGCELEEKERFWSELDEVMESIPTGDEEVMGKFGVKERNLEGQMVVDFVKRMDMGVVNTYFQKREEHRVTYKSGARQHRMVVCRMTLMKLRQALGGQVVLPDDWETTAEVIRETGRKVLGVSSGRRKEDKETCWWNEEVQDSIQRKRLAKKKWDMDRTEENRQEYKELQRRVKREVSKAKQKAYDELYTRLDTREGEKDLYRLARQRDRDGKDVQQVRVIKDRDGRVLTSEESVQRRWKEYFEELMNEENEREKRVEGVNSVAQKVDKIRKDEVRKALKRMKSGKAVGPDDIPVEVWKCLGEAAVEFLTSLFNRVLESERMPEEWRRSVLVPIFKNKGDVQSCSNYRGIKLMSHTMKIDHTDQYRLSAHTLAMETGRYKRSWLLTEQRVCIQCNSNTVETELHFLTEEVAFGCSLFGVATAYQLVRTSTWHRFYAGCPSCRNPPIFPGLGPALHPVAGVEALAGNRTRVFRMIAASSLWHKLACVDPPPNLLASIRALLVDFFWDGLHWIPQSVLHLPKEEGGQGLVQLASRTAAFRLQFLQRLLTGPKDGEQ
ncbi:hypothetical protein QTP86_005623 [Hemibagrus guttatus]|nr:hypothetical protein QTP86_005623 [Hemibagrus guttatus]